MDDQDTQTAALNLTVADYFDELLERIRNIRSSERRMYQRITEILALSADYEKSSDESSHFFRSVQNKLHYAATGLTAAQIVSQRADQRQPNMGLTSWQGATVRKSDVTIAKNYLTQDEISTLDRLLVQWLDFAEERVLHRQQVFMSDWLEILDDFLRLEEREVLADTIDNLSREQANIHAEREYEQFAARRHLLLKSERKRSQLAELIREARRAAHTKDNGKTP